MRGGDISNETPPRIIVTIDTVVKSELTPVRGLLSRSPSRRVVSLNNEALAKLWLVSSKYGLSVELAAFESDFWNKSHLDKVMDKLERRGGNPFNYAELYDDIEELISELPYRGNLKGIITESNGARFGSWGIDLENL